MVSISTVIYIYMFIVLILCKCICKGFITALHNCNRLILNMKQLCTFAQHSTYFPCHSVGYTRRTIAYDTKANRFVKCENMKDRRMHHSATAINNKLYVTGGRYINSREIIEDSDGFDCYDPESDAWSSKGKLPYRLYDHGAVSLIYVSSKSFTP